MLKRSILIFLISILSFSCVGYRRQKMGLEIRTKGISWRVDRVLKYYYWLFIRRKPGGALMMIHDGQVVHSSSSGMANLEEKLAITPATSFGDWTVLSEMITVALLKLVDQGHITLDDSIISYIPELTGVLSEEASLGHLLSSTTGLSLPRDVFDGEEIWDPQRLLEYCLEAEDPIAFAPGRSCDFSALPILAFGSLILERVSGEPLDVFLNDLLLTPLGLEHSTIVTGVDGPSADALNYYRRTDGYLPVENPEIQCYPRINTTMQDIARWYTALDGGSILSEEMMDLYLQSVKTENGEVVNLYTYNYNRGNWSMAGVRVDTHQSGAVSYCNSIQGDYGSATLYYPEQNLRVFVYSNSPSRDVASFFYTTFMPEVLGPAYQLW